MNTSTTRHSSLFLRVRLLNGTGAPLRYLWYWGSNKVEFVIVKTISRGHALSHNNNNNNNDYYYCVLMLDALDFEHNNMISVGRLCGGQRDLIIFQKYSYD